MFNITAAQFKIGHTLRKFPDAPSATSRFIAYLLQSRKIYFSTHSHAFQVFFKIFLSFSRRIMLILSRTLYALLTKTHYFMNILDIFFRFIHLRAYFLRYNGISKNSVIPYSHIHCPMTDFAKPRSSFASAANCGAEAANIRSACTKSLLLLTAQLYA